MAPIEAQNYRNVQLWTKRVVHLLVTFVCSMYSRGVATRFCFQISCDRGLVVVITATALSFVWTCWSIRIWLRFNTREWRSDDYFLAAATILDTIQSGLVFRVVDEGLGQSQEERLTVLILRQIGKHDLASQLLYVVTLLLSKYAVLSLYLRLSPQNGHAIATWSSIAVSSIWAVIAIALIAAPCSAIEFWPEGLEGCSNLMTKWTAIGALDIFTEVVIFSIALYLVVGLHMEFSSKVLVVAAFSARLPVIAAAIARLIYLSRTLTSKDRTLSSAYYIVSTQWQLGYAIMSCTITGLGPFLRPFSKSSTSVDAVSNTSGESKRWIITKKTELRVEMGSP